MNFLALFVGLGLERLLTQLFHLREFDWLDPLFDRLLSDQRWTQPNMAIAAAAMVTALLVVPVGLIEMVLTERLAYIPQFLFAVVVLLFCLGPRDLGKEVDDYCQALQAQNHDEVRDVAHELLERWPEPDEIAPDIETAIYAQANNRIFGVVFWFVMLGPSGAWLIQGARFDAPSRYATNSDSQDQRRRYRATRNRAGDITVALLYCLDPRAVAGDRLHAGRVIMTVR